jgi:hypothetical protein
MKERHNPVSYSLSGKLAAVAEGDRRGARWFPADVAPFLSIERAPEALSSPEIFSRYYCRSVSVGMVSLSVLSRPLRQPRGEPRDTLAIQFS